MLEILRKRRSVRRYKDVSIENEKITKLVKSALLSPSSRGLRPWEFIAITDKSVLNKLSKCKQHGSSFLKDAPLGIVVVADPAKCDVWIEDASIASIIIQLTAESLELGSCWIQIRERWHDDKRTAEDYVREVLGLPGKMKVLSIIAIGYPDVQKSPTSDDSLCYDKVHLNQYGSPYKA